MLSIWKGNTFPAFFGISSSVARTGVYLLCRQDEYEGLVWPSHFPLFGSSPVPRSTCVSIVEMTRIAGRALYMAFDFFAEAVSLSGTACFGLCLAMLKESWQSGEAADDLTDGEFRSFSHL